MKWGWFQKEYIESLKKQIEDLRAEKIEASKRHIAAVAEIRNENASLLKQITDCKGHTVQMPSDVSSTPIGRKSMARVIRAYEIANSVKDS